MASPVGYEQLLCALEESLQDQPGKTSLMNNLCHSPAPWKNALYSIFCAQKHELVQQTSRIVEKKAQTPIIEPQKRLDSLLLECTRCSAQTAKIQYEYDKNFSRLRDDFFAESKYCDEAYQQLTNELVQMLRDHSLFRPISQTDYNSELARLEDKFTKMRTQLKLTTCQTALTMRSRLMETKRRRRNFPKDTTRILNEHFYANYEHQYPSEEMKTHLAERCGMTVAQVSNWFGNKRIRHNKMKNTPKGQKEYEMYTGRRLPTSTSKGGARNGGVQAVSVDYPEPPSL